MNLTLKRLYLKEKYTIGNLYIDGIYFCDTIEDKVRDLTTEPKVPGETAVPCGAYKLVLSMSKRFKKILPELLGVPYFEGVRIHSGNTELDSEGCIIVGLNKIPGKVIESRLTLEALIKKLEYQDNIDITIEV